MSWAKLTGGTNDWARRLSALHAVVHELVSLLRAEARTFIYGVRSVCDGPCLAVQAELDGGLVLMKLMPH